MNGSRGMDLEGTMENGNSSKKDTFEWMKECSKKVWKSEALISHEESKIYVVQNEEYLNLDWILKKLGYCNMRIKFRREIFDE